MPDYTIIAQPLITYHDEHSGKIVEGREVDFRDNRTGDHGRVRVPLSDYPHAVAGLIEEELAKIRHVRNLGTPPPPAGS